MNYLTLEEGKQQTNTWIVPVYTEDRIPPVFAQALDYDPSEQIKREAGQLTTLFTMGKMAAPSICFVAMGKKKDITYGKAKRYFGNAFYAQKEDCCFYVDSAASDTCSMEQMARAAGFASVYSTYRMQKIEAEQNDAPAVAFVSDQDLQAAIAEGMEIAACINHARDLGNLPSNYLTPDTFVEKAKALAEELEVEIEVLDKEALTKMGAGALLGVNRGSDKGAYLLTLTYRGNGDAPMTALVGKGITFDSGGYCLKPRTSMTGMKYDMCGAANMLSTLEYAARTKAKVNLMAVLALTENKMGPNGFTPDEVLISLSGKTIEVTNTDAEGRLILCDAITHAANKKAARIIDMATLTGACVTALGNRYTGTFTNDPAFLEALNNAAKESGELVWQLPLDAEFKKQVQNSDVADLINSIPNGKGGSSLAAAFLSAFVPEQTQWIHLDVAGPAETTASSSYAAKGATGVMVETLIQLLCK